MAVVAGKGAKVQEIGLKKQASRWPSAYPIACRCRLRVEVIAAATQGVWGRLPQASRASYAACSQSIPIGQGTGG
jgi:hypothetical protein